MNCLFCPNHDVKDPVSKRIYIGGSVNSCKGCGTVYYWEVGKSEPYMYNITTIYNGAQYQLYINLKEQRLQIQKAGVMGSILKLDFIPPNITPINAATKLAILLVFS